MKKFLLFSFVIVFVGCAHAPLHAAKAEKQKAAARAEENFATEIYFSSNSYEVEPSEMALLQQNVSWLKSHPNAVFILEGHCDEWGEDSYNLQLGDLRAREIKSYLMEQGINSDRVIMIVSFGESHPLDERHLPDAWRKNRRVEFVLR